MTAALNYCQHWITEELYRLRMSISLTVQILFLTLATVQVRKTLWEYCSRTRILVEPVTHLKSEIVNPCS
jgi:hypothetical protein